MGKRKKPDPLISELEHALDPGEFISYNRSWDFVRDLEDLKHKIDALVKDGNAQRAVSLYEIFLSDCYEKADEIDDSGGNLGMFFEDLFCAWISYGWMLLKECSAIIPENTDLSLILRK